MALNRSVRPFSAEERLLQDAILDVIDSGPPARPAWEMYEDVGAQTEDGANADRLDFSRAVIERWRYLKQSDDDQQAFDRR